jgi:hypothetical protein
LSLGNVRSSAQQANECYWRFAAHILLDVVLRRGGAPNGRPPDDRAESRGACGPQEVVQFKPISFVFLQGRAGVAFPAVAM